MSILNRIKTWLGSKSIDSLPERRLNAESEAVLSASLRNLILGADGWITLDDARRLFSPVKEPRYAFGEVDDVGKSSLTFVAHNTASST
jgi:hypothetical protein